MKSLIQKKLVQILQTDSIIVDWNREFMTEIQFNSISAKLGKINGVFVSEFYLE